MALCWLLDLDLGGRTLRLSSRPTSYGGHQYEGGLDAVTLRESIGQLGSLPDERSAVVDVAPWIDLAQLVSYGHDLAAGRGTLRLWDEAEPQHRAVVHLLDARCTTPSVGGAAEVLSLTLSGEPYDDTASILDADARVSTGTWPNAAPGEAGRLYPLPMGSAGSYVDGTGTTKRAPATPAIAVEYVTPNANTLLVSAEPVEASTVEIWYRIDDVRGSYITGTITTTTDGAGRRVAVVDISGEATAVRQAGEWWCSWSPSGLPAFSSVRPRAILTVGDLLLEMVARASVPVDLASWRQVATLLSTRCGWYVSEEMPPLDALLQVASDLPLGLWSSPAGLAAVRLPSEVRRSQCVPLVEGVTAHRIDRMTMPRRPWEALTEVRVAYASDEARDGPRQWVIRSRGRRSDVYVRTSRDPGEADAVDEVDLPWTYDSATAQLVGAWRSRSKAVSPRVVRLHVPAVRARSLLIGQPVTYTAADLYLDREVGIVTARELTDRPMWELEVSLLASTASAVPETGAGAYDTPPPTGGGQ